MQRAMLDSAALTRKIKNKSQLVRKQNTSDLSQAEHLSDFLDLYLDL